MESFSDGVIAVAVTLLVLGIAVPAVDAKPHASLITHLLHQWPSYAAYVVSFVTIGIIWINHHAMISRLAQADHEILIMNLLLLLSIGILPFATNLMATYLRTPSDQSVAAAVYSGAFLVMAILFAALNRTILIRKPHMITEPLPLQRRRRILSRALAGLAPYAIATPLAFVSPYITLAICAIVAGYYAHPIASGERE